MTVQDHIGLATLAGRVTRREVHAGVSLPGPGVLVIYPKQGTSELIPQGQSQPTGCYQLQNV